MGNCNDYYQMIKLNWHQVFVRAGARITHQKVLNLLSDGFVMGSCRVTLVRTPSGCWNTNFMVGLCITQSVLRRAHSTTKSHVVHGHLSASCQRSQPGPTWSKIAQRSYFEIQTRSCIQTRILPVFDSSKIDTNLKKPSSVCS
jgi:hypothetical protein